MLTGVRKTQAAETGTASRTSLEARAGRFLLLLACSLAVFLLGLKHYRLFPTSGSRLYGGVLPVVFLIAALSFKRSERFRR